nr:MAG TPA: hypothetical protein [Caudoviricetes sp.]
MARTIKPNVPSRNTSDGRTQKLSQRNHRENT